MSESTQAGGPDDDEIFGEDDAHEALEERLSVLKSLPSSKQNSAILEEIVTLTFTLQNAIIRLRKKTADDIREEAERARRENSRVRRRVTFTILTSVVISLATAIIGDNVAINHCFLRSGTLHKSTLCNTLFPGYNKNVAQQQKLLLQFNSLVAEIPQNKAKIKHVEDEIAELRKEIASSHRPIGH